MSVLVDFPSGSSWEVLDFDTCSVSDSRVWGGCFGVGDVCFFQSRDMMVIESIVCEREAFHVARLNAVLEVPTRLLEKSFSRPHADDLPGVRIGAPDVPNRGENSGRKAMRFFSFFVQFVLRSFVLLLPSSS